MLAWHMQRLGRVCTSGSVASVCLQCTQRNVHKIGKKNCVAVFVKISVLPNAKSLVLIQYGTIHVLSFQSLNRLRRATGST